MLAAIIIGCFNKKSIASLPRYPKVCLPTHARSSLARESGPTHHGEHGSIHITDYGVVPATQHAASLSMQVPATSMGRLGFFPVLGRHHAEVLPVAPCIVLGSVAVPSGILDSRTQPRPNGTPGVKLHRTAGHSRLSWATSKVGSSETYKNQFGATPSLSQHAATLKPRYKRMTTCAIAPPVPR